jgi:predicted acylesterase/phospholipase RssA
LVLEGGGAKGAYAFGCLLAFRDQGLTFHAVAGSSVGGLNAAIWAADRVEAAHSLWDALAFRSVLKWRFTLLNTLLLPFHLLGVWISRRSRWNLQTPRDGLRFNGPLAIRIAFGTPLFILFIAFMSESPAVLYFAGAVFIATMTLALPLVVPYLIEALRLHYVDLEPLGKSIAHVLGSSPYQVPTYITLCRGVPVFDPDKPALWEDSEFPAWIIMPTSHVLFVPEYVRLDQLTPPAATSVLVATASMPFGVSEPIRLDGTEYMDGGAADNLPLYPLVTEEACNEIIVVRTRPDVVEPLELHWQLVDRAIRLGAVGMKGREIYEAERGTIQFGSTPEDYWNDPPKHIPLREFPRRGLRITVIAPERRLGGFWTGTLSFRPRYARRLIERGYRDARKALSRSSGAVAV